MPEYSPNHGRPRRRSTLLASLAVGAGLAVIFGGPVSAAPAWGHRPGSGGSTTTTTGPATTTTTTPATSGSDACGAPVPKAEGGYWQCTLDAEFTGSSLDSSVWAPETTAATGLHNGAECLVDSPDNISVGGGVLTLTVRKEAQPFLCQDPQGSFYTQYTGASVFSYGLFSQAYGRFEVRAKVPSTSTPGLQESFWLWPNNDLLYGPWPYSGEIDIAEVYSAYADRAIPYIHYNNVLDTNVTNDYCMINVGDWNTYDLVWTPTYLQIVYNGNTCLTDYWNPLAPQVKPQPFNQPFFMALTAVLGQTLNSVNPFTPLPATTEVQYVKVWK